MSGIGFKCLESFVREPVQKAYGNRMAEVLPSAWGYDWARSLTHHGALPCVYSVTVNSLKWGRIAVWRVGPAHSDGMTALREIRRGARGVARLFAECVKSGHKSGHTHFFSLFFIARFQHVNR